MQFPHTDYLACAYICFGAQSSRCHKMVKLGLSSSHYTTYRYTRYTIREFDRPWIRQTGVEPVYNKHTTLAHRMQHSTMKWAVKSIGAAHLVQAFNTDVRVMLAWLNTSIGKKNMEQCLQLYSSIDLSYPVLQNKHSLALFLWMYNYYSR
jgi:hypothetical protein